MNGTKRCLECGVLQPFFRFRFFASGPVGRDALCVDCRQKRTREARQRAALNRWYGPEYEFVPKHKVQIVHATPAHLPPIILEGWSDGRYIMANGVFFGEEKEVCGTNTQS